MNCRQAERAILAAVEGALPPTELAGLESHLATCAGCRRLLAQQALVGPTLRAAAGQVPLPQIETEWLAIRRALRDGAAESETGRAWNWRRGLAVAVPLGAAAALALALGLRAWGPAEPARLAQTEGIAARAEFVQADEPAASPLVYLDEPSGWLVVWTVPGDPAGAAQQ